MATSPRAKRTPVERAVYEIERGQMDDDLNAVLQAVLRRTEAITLRKAWTIELDDGTVVSEREITVAEADRIEVATVPLDEDGRRSGRRPMMLVNPAMAARDRAGVFQVLLETRGGLSHDDAVERAWTMADVDLAERCGVEVVPAPLSGSGSTTS